MQIPVRLSAALAQISGAPRLQIIVSDGATVADVIAALTAVHPELASRLPRAVPMVGGRHAALDDRVNEGEEVAFLLPVAGGAG